LKEETKDVIFSIMSNSLGLTLAEKWKMVGIALAGTTVNYNAKKKTLLLRYIMTEFINMGNES
jgi:hypothetical protein